VLGELSSE
jgi:hypothetical protein